MSLLITMLPFYLFGNLHCAGMCGPLTLMLGRHRFRYFYFIGRLISFSLAGLAAGAAGSVLSITLHQYHISAAACFVFGILIILIGVKNLAGLNISGPRWISRRAAKANQSLSLLMLKDQPWPTFLFGFFTIALPCGQTVVVFSACALYGDAWTGFINGFCFALLTTPALFAAMHAQRLFQKAKQHYNTIMGIFAIIIGALAICRGLAEIDLIPHLVLNSQAPAHYHLVIY